MRADAQTQGGRIDRAEWRALAPLFLLMAVGLALRLWSIDSRGLWLDEAVSIAQAKQSLPLVIETMTTGVHPPLFHLLMHLWLRVFGATEPGLRAFATLWGVLAIPAAYWATRHMFDRRSGLIAAAITALSPYLIWYSQEARMYSMMLFFGFMSVGFLALAVRDNRTRDWLGYTAFTFLGMFTHYFFVFLVLGQVAYFVALEVLAARHRLKQEGRALFTWSRPRTLFLELPKLLPWLMSMAFLAGSYLLWLNRSIILNAGANALVASATGQGLGYGQPPPELALRFNDVGRVVVEMLLGFHAERFTFAMVAMWPLVISLALVLFDHMEEVARKATVALWSALGLIVISILGQWQGQALASRYYIALAAPTVILIAGVLGALPRSRRQGVLLVGVLVSLAAWTSQSYRPDNAIRFEYREALTTIEEQYRTGDVVVYEPFYLDPIVLYYLSEKVPSFPFPQFGEFGRVRRGKVELGEDIERTVGPARRVWLVLSFQDIPDARGDAYNSMMWFERNGYTTVSDTQYNRVRVLLYESNGVTSPIDMMGVTP